jgi:hypothetical protein
MAQESLVDRDRRLRAFCDSYGHKQDIARRVAGNIDA